MALENTSFTIKDWCTHDRPREKLMLLGKNKLSDAELLAILIGSGNTNESAVALCQRILGAVKNNLNRLAAMTLLDFKAYSGIGEAKAISIIAALELGRRRNYAAQEPIQKIQSSRMAYNLLRRSIGAIQHEEFWVLFLDNSKNVIRQKQMSSGGQTMVTVDVRMILREALNASATALIVGHNHPSGGPEPSNADKELTIHIQKAAQTIGIPLLDHIIVSENTYFSFADQGLL